MLLFIPCSNQQPTACTVEREFPPQSSGGSRGPLVTSQETSGRRQKPGETKRGRESLTTGPRRCWALHSKQIPGERQLGITRSPGQRYTPLICSWSWALVDKGRLAFSSLFCLTAVKLPFSKATFRKKDDIYQSLLSG